MVARLWNYFSYLGAFSASVVAIVTMLQLVPSVLIADTFIERSMATLARWVAPSGYQVKPSYIDVVQPGDKGEAFELEISNLVDLDINGKMYPLTVTDVDTLGRTGISLPGGWVNLGWGDRKNIEGTDCYIQLAKKPKDSSETSVAIMKFYCEE